MIHVENGKIVYRYDAETVWIESWGSNALRVRATKNAHMPEENWALTEPVDSVGEAWLSEEGAVLQNRRNKLEFTEDGKITVFNERRKLELEDDWRNQKDVTDENAWP